MVILFGLQAALAQAPPPPPPPPADEDAPIEVIVYGQLLIEQARQEVVEELGELGFDDTVIDLGDHRVYRHAAPWHGEVVLYDDGFMVVRRQPLHVVGVQMPWAKKDTPLAWAGCVLWPWACVRVNGALVGERKWRSRESLTVAQVQPKVQHWADRIADLAVDQKVEALPAMLEGLWEAGRPLSGDGPTLATYRERRAALLAFWESRTDTSWGQQVRGAVLAYCRGVVQRSDHPFTEREVARFNADRENPIEIGRP